MHDRPRFDVTFRTLRGLSPDAVVAVCSEVGGEVCGVIVRALRGPSSQAATGG